MSFWHFQKPRHGCCPAVIFKIPKMVVVLLPFLKEKSRYGCCPAGIFKSLDMVIVLLALLK